MSQSPPSEGDPEWSGERVERWLRQAEGVERQLAPVSDLLFAAAGLRPGERVLDVGCGRGPTTRHASRAVGAAGAVTGLDISTDMLDAARQATTPADGTIRWIAADVETWDPDDARFDVVLSRFGVMFFSDPPTAFRRLAGATAPDGRLAIAIWARRDASELFEVPLAAAMAALRTDGIDVEEPPAGGGPFSLGDRDVVTALMTGAGWSDVAWQPHALSMTFGGGMSPAAAASAALDIGPVRLVTAGIDDDEVRSRVRDAVATALADHVDASDQVVLGGEIIIVTARRQPPD